MQILIETSKKENLLNNHFRIYETNHKKKKKSLKNQTRSFDLNWETIYPEIVYRQTSNELENSKGKKVEKEWKAMDEISLNLVEGDRHFEKAAKPGNNPDRVSTQEGREGKGRGEVLKDS